MSAGILWGSYFVPAQQAGVSLWTANVSLAAGTTAGGALLVLVAGRPWALPSGLWLVRLLVAGALWGTGNIGMLILTERIGVGKGFTIAQLILGVNALVGIMVFQNPRPGSRAGAVTLTGVVLAISGGVLLGQLK